MHNKLPILKCSAVQFHLLVYRGNSYHCHFEFVAAIRVESTQRKLRNIFNACATVVENSSKNVAA